MTESRKILIVDDNASVRRIVRGLIETQADLRVCGEAVDGVDAIEKSKQLEPDLILLDLRMPRLNGAAAASILKRLMPKVPIILFTMYEEAVGKLAPAVGIDVVLAKREGMSNLLPRVRQLFESHPDVGLFPADALKQECERSAS
jgi:CheY-like chemotaxis protein